MHFVKYLRGAAALILFAGAVPLRADVVIASTFSGKTPPFETDTGNAWAVGTPSNIEVAVGFQDPSPSVSYLLTQIQVGDNFFTADAAHPALNNLNLALLVNSTNDPNTATSLQSWSIAPAQSPGTPGQTYTVTSGIPTTISPGLFYFLMEWVTPDGANTAEWGWQENNLGPPMQIGFYSGTFGVPGSWTFNNVPCTNTPCNASNDPNASGTPAYVVNGTASVPEPTSWMLGLTVMGLFAYEVKRRRAV